MKIALYHELPVGGARNATNEIANILRQKHVVDLFTLGDIDHEKKYYSHTYNFAFQEIDWNGSNWRKKVEKDTFELVRLYFLNKKIASQIRDGNYDLVFIHASKYIEAPFLLRFENAKKVFFLHDPYYRYIYEDSSNLVKRFGLMRGFYEWVMRNIRKRLDAENVNGADLYIANSRFTKKIFDKTYKKRAEVAALGIDTNYFKPSKREDRDIDLLYIGSRFDLDGYDTYLDIKKKLSNDVKLKELFFEDEWLDRSQMRRLYQQSKIVLCLARKEPLGLVALEGMACGAVVVAVNEGGYKDTVVAEETGYLLKRDPDNFAKIINKLLKNTSLRKKISDKAMRHVLESWSLDMTVLKIERLFLKILK